VKRSAAIRFQFAAWLIYWLFLLVINLLYFKADHYPKPLLALWTVLYTLFGAGLFFLLTRVYRPLMKRGKSKTVLFAVSIILSFVAAYVWGLAEPVLSWAINPEIHQLNVKWDINSRGTIGLTFLLAFFSFLHFFAQNPGDSPPSGVPASETREAKSAGLRTVTVYHQNSIVLLPLEEIKKISVVGNYSTVIDIRNRKYETKRSLKTWEKELETDSFLRIHRSTIINRQYIEKIDLEHNATLRIKMTGLEPPEEVSRRYAVLLKKRLNI